MAVTQSWPRTAVIPRRSSNLSSKRLCGTQLRKNIGVFDPPRVRSCILRTSWATSPASPALSASAPAKDADDASDAGDVAKEHHGKCMEMNDMK